MWCICLDDSVCVASRHVCLVLPTDRPKRRERPFQIPFISTGCARCFIIQRLFILRVRARMKSENVLNNTEYVPLWGKSLLKFRESFTTFSAAATAGIAIFPSAADKFGSKWVTSRLGCVSQFGIVYRIRLSCSGPT